jgi:hypothetical protein
MRRLCRVSDIAVGGHSRRSRTCVVVSLVATQTREEVRTDLPLTINAKENVMHVAKKSVAVKLTTVMLVIVAVMVMVADGLSRGTITLAGLGWTVGGIVFLMAALLAYCIAKENQEQGWRRC